MQQQEFVIVADSGNCRTCMSACVSSDGSSSTDSGNCHECSIVSTLK